MADQKDALLGIINSFDEGTGGGGRGVFTKTRIDTAYRTFLTGVPPEQALRIYDSSVPGADKEAAAAISNVITAAGGDLKTTRPIKCIVYTCFAAENIGSTWSGDQVRLLVNFSKFWVDTVEKDAEGKEVKTPGAAKAALTRLTQEGKFVGFGKEYWAHLHVAVDTGRKPGADGRPQTVWYVDEIYASKEEMAKAAEHAGGGEAVEGAGTGANGRPFPPSYPPDVWFQTEPEVLKAIGDNWTAPHLAQIAKDYEVEVSFLKTLKPA